MASNIFRRTFSVMSRRSTFLNVQQVLTNQAPIAIQMLVNTKPMVQLRFASEERPTLGLRKQKLPPYPEIETECKLDVETYYKIVKHGDYEFLESRDGYAMIYITGYANPRKVDAIPTYAVYFGKNHPLNLHGPVVGRQSIKHAKLFAFMLALKQIPENTLEKVCICIGELPLITFVNESLRSMSENSFRSVLTGKLNKDLETSMEVNRILRTRQDFTLRLKFVPNKVGQQGMYDALKLAQAAAVELNKPQQREFH